MVLQAHRTTYARVAMQCMAKAEIQVGTVERFVSHEMQLKAATGQADLRITTTVLIFAYYSSFGSAHASVDLLWGRIQRR